MQKNNHFSFNSIRVIFMVFILTFIVFSNANHVFCETEGVNISLKVSVSVYADSYTYTLTSYIDSDSEEHFFSQGNEVFRNQKESPTLLSNEEIKQWAVATASARKSDEFLKNTNVTINLYYLDNDLKETMPDKVETFYIANVTDVYVDDSYIQNAIGSSGDIFEEQIKSFNNIHKDGISFTSYNMRNLVLEFQSEMKSSAKSYNFTKNQKDNGIKGRVTMFALECAMSRELSFNILNDIINSSSPVNGDNIIYGYANGTYTAENLVNDLIPILIQADEEDLVSGATYARGNITDYYLASIGGINGDAISSGSVGAGGLIGSGFLHVLSGTFTPLVRDISNSIAYDVSWGIVDILSKVDESILDFSPSIDRFLGYFGGLNANNEYAEDSQIFNLNKLFFYLGGILALLIFVVTLFKIIINPENLSDEDKNRDIVEIVVRFGIVMLAIYLGRSIISTVYTLSQNIWDWCFVDAGSKFQISRDMDSFVLYKTVSLVTYNYFNIEWSYEVIGVLFNLAIGIIVLKNVLMLFMEAVERYVVSCMLYFAFPTAVSLGVSKSTDNVTKSYFRMLITQIFMLFMNIYFIAGFMILLRNLHMWADSMYGVIFVLAYLKVAQAFDSYLGSLGLSVAHTSGAMGRELFSAGATMMTGLMMLGRLGKTLANGGTKVIGAGLSTGAVLSGKNGNIASRVFNMGENLRQRGMGGILSGARMNAQTQNSFLRAQAMRQGAQGIFKGMLGGTISGNEFNARFGSRQIIDSMLGNGQGIVGEKGYIGNAGANLRSASVSNFGGVINGVTHHGNNISLSDSAGKLSNIADKNNGFSTVRYNGKAIGGTEMYGVTDFNSTRLANMVGQSQTLVKGSLDRATTGEYAMSGVEASFGFDLSKTNRGNAILNGEYGDVTFTVQDNNTIHAVSSDGTDLGYFGSHGATHFASLDDYKVDAVAKCDIDQFNSLYSGELNGECIGMINREMLDNPAIVDSVTWDADSSIPLGRIDEIDDKIAETVDDFEKTTAFAVVSDMGAMDETVKYAHQPMYDTDARWEEYYADGVLDKDGNLCKVTPDDRKEFESFVSNISVLEEERVQCSNQAQAIDELFGANTGKLNAEGDCDVVVIKDYNGDIHLYEGHSRLVSEDDGAQKSSTVFRELKPIE